MNRYNYAVRDNAGSVMPTRSVWIYNEVGAATLAALFDSTGAPAANPTTTNATGFVDVYCRRYRLWYVVDGDSTVRPMVANTNPTGLFDARDYDGAGDGVTDDTDALAAAMTAAGVAGGTVYVAPGTWLTDTPIAVPANVSVLLDHAATIKATAAMDAILRTPDDVLASYQVIQGGVLDCNGLAKIGVHLRYFHGYDLRRLRVIEWTEQAYSLGSATSTGMSSEARLHGCTTWRSGNVPANSVGILIANSSDHQIAQTIIHGAETGVRIGAAGDTVCGNCDLVGVHAWVTNPVAYPMKYAFHDYCNGTRYTNCYADSPSIYGWYLEGGMPTLANCHAFNNSSSADNAAIAVKFSNVAPTGSIVGLEVYGASAAHRFAQDIETGTAGAPNLRQLRVYGCQTINCTKSYSVINYLRDDPRYGVFIASDLWNGAIQQPWSGGAISGGTLGNVVATYDHPGVASMLCALNTANSGYYAFMSNLELNGLEVAEFIASIVLTASTKAYLGLHNTISVTAPTKGCWFLIDGTTVTGQTGGAGVTSTGTTATIVQGTYYRYRLAVASDLLSCTFTIYSADGSVFWTDTCATAANMPASTDYSRHAIVVFTTASQAAQSLAYLDYMSLSIPRSLAR